MKDPNQLSHCLLELPPTVRAGSMVALIHRATASSSDKDLLMNLPESVASDILEETRNVCSLPGLSCGVQRPSSLELTESLPFFLQIFEGAKDCGLCSNNFGQRISLLRRLLIALARKTQRVPRSFLISGVHLPARDAVGGGGFADIFRASYRGQFVALKRLRTFVSQPPSISEINVSNIY